MQAMAEGFDILRNKSSEKLPEDHRFDLNMGDIAEVWRRGSVVSSWLLDLTADAMAHQRDHYRALGMDGFVAKPLSVALLMQAVAMAVGEAPAPGVFDKALSGR